VLYSIYGLYCIQVQQQKYVYQQHMYVIQFYITYAYCRHWKTQIWFLGYMLIKVPPSNTPFVAFSADQSVGHSKLLFHQDIFTVLPQLQTSRVIMCFTNCVFTCFKVVALAQYSEAPRPRVICMFVCVCVYVLNENANPCPSEDCIPRGCTTSSIG